MTSSDCLKDIYTELKTCHGIMAFLFVAQLAVFSYYFTFPMFGNHTIPSVYIRTFPSYTTTEEGRWLHDLLIFLLGGGGNQGLNVILALMVRAVTSVLFRIYLGGNCNKDILFHLAFIFYPSFVDYFAFQSDAFAYAFGDLLAVIALILSRCFSGIKLLFSVFAFVLSMSAHSAKVSLVVFLCIVPVAMYLLSGDIKGVLRVMGRYLLLAAFSVLLYYAVIKCIVAVDNQRTYINSNFNEICDSLVACYRIFFAKVHIGTLYEDIYACVLCGIAMAAVCKFALQIKNAVCLLLFACIAAVMPVVVCLPAVINIKAQWFMYAGRVAVADPFLISFLVFILLREGGLKFARHALIALFVYFNMVICSQNSNVFAYKNIYDINWMQAIARKVESVVAGDGAHSLVVIGNYPQFESNRYMRILNRYDHYSLSYAFDIYRQPMMLNFFLGKNILRFPTKREVALALEEAEGHGVWPAEDSAFSFAGIVVVKFADINPAANNVTLGY